MASSGTDVAGIGQALVPTVLADGRKAHLVGMGGPATAPLLTRITGQIGAAADAVTAFWGTDWPQDITVVATATDGQFTALTGFGGGTAAATTSKGIVFSPGAGLISDDALRIVLRHELFHYATRRDTAADGPRWLTEGVADYVARPRTVAPQPLSSATELPSDTDLATEGPAQTLAYDRAWSFTRFIAERFGEPSLRALYVRACGHGHPDLATAMREVLGEGTAGVLADWRHSLGR